MRKEGIVWVLLKSKPDKWYKAGLIKNGKKDEFFRLGGEITADVIDWHFLSEVELQMDIFFKPLEKHDIEKIRKKPHYT